MTDLLEIPLYDDDLVKLAFRFAHNLLFMVLIVRFAWHPNRRDREFAFTAVMLNITVFFICFTMKKLELSLGMALGLFAIFGVLRYRTETIRTREMTYLFVVIGIAVINSLTNNKTSYAELLVVNGLIFAATLIGERLIARMRRTAQAASQSDEPQQRKGTLEYDNLAMLAPDRYHDLLEDLRQRTNLPLTRVRVTNIDLPRGVATLSIWYDDINGDDSSGADDN